MTTIRSVVCGAAQPPDADRLILTGTARRATPWPPAGVRAHAHPILAPQALDETGPRA